MKNYKKVISYILAFLLSLCIISAVILGFISSSILNGVNVRKSMRDTNYYYNIYSIIKDTANDYVLQSGFDEKVLDNVITDVQVQSDINRVVDGLYNNQPIEVKTDGIRKTLQENIQKQIEERGEGSRESLSSETKANIKEFEDSVISAYTTNLYYSQDTIKQISKYLQKIRKIVNIIVISLCVVIAILVAIIFKMNEPAINVGVLIAGLFFIVLKTYSLINIAINNILILNWAFSRTLVYILKGLVQKIFITGIVFVIIGIIGIVLSECMKRRKIKKINHTHENQERI